ncbi:hypothetical protein BDD12DRAFT_820843 [Trichophaea hybrida]|nr:hypothetical protein BDD12DRAFT_820843 [Trichophaea hybrida]
MGDHDSCLKLSSCDDDDDGYWNDCIWIFCLYFFLRGYWVKTTREGRETEGVFLVYFVFRFVFLLRLLLRIYQLDEGVFFFYLPS